MISKIPGGEDSRLDPSHCTHEHRFDSRSAFPQCIRNGQSRHEVPAGAAPGDEDPAGQLGSGAAGQSYRRKINHGRARPTALLFFAHQYSALAVLLSRSPAALPTPSGVLSDPLPGDFPGDGRC
jgi:hypothetical protein